FAPPPTGNGGGDDNALTINPDHPVGAAHNHHSSAVTPFPSNDGIMGMQAADVRSCNMVRSVTI
ncbi:hypothetical protein, partial [Sphingomonas sp. CCH9-F2]|uniref:hypothetical protein n=1 Tax=Sphingomonas sp. CCH9-F2 TaxID=1768778 RepID=UPI001E56D33C